jgi:2,4-dienoyl-CoA reductase-like NADH-dependent reductase (Old Yellow Enzyme family)
MSSDLLFQPFKLKGLNLRNGVTMAGLVGGQ